MLDIKVTIDDRKLRRKIRIFGSRVDGAVKRGIITSTRGVYAEALKWLSGSGAKASNVPAGGYPVPVRTGHLRRLLNWLRPGATKTADGLTFTAGPFEGIVYDSAEYADVIHEGKLSSRKFGPRRYAEDALEIYNRASRIQRNIEHEIEKIKPR